jgi:hypothetical protein
MAEIGKPIQVDAALLQRYIETLGSIGWQSEEYHSGSYASLRLRRVAAASY